MPSSSYFLFLTGSPFFGRVVLLPSPRPWSDGGLMPDVAGLYFLTQSPSDGLGDHLDRAGCSGTALLLPWRLTPDHVSSLLVCTRWPTVAVCWFFTWRHSEKRPAFSLFPSRSLYAKKKVSALPLLTLILLFRLGEVPEPEH